MTRTKNRGFVLLTAMMILPLVAIALVVLASLSSARAHQTLDRSRQAQIDQLLLAAAIEAHEHLTTQPVKIGDSWRMQIPPSLVWQNASVETKVISADADGHLSLSVQATLDWLEERQTLEFIRDQNQWRLKSSELE
jgi:type II secretory pathway component PulK